MGPSKAAIVFEVAITRRFLPHLRRVLALRFRSGGMVLFIPWRGGAERGAGTDHGPGGGHGAGSGMKNPALRSAPLANG